MVLLVFAWHGVVGVKVYAMLQPVRLRHIGSSNHGVFHGIGRLTLCFFSSILDLLPALSPSIPVFTISSDRRLMELINHPPWATSFFT